MIRKVLGFSVLLMAFSAPAGHAALPATVDGQPLPSLAPILTEVTPSVVNIHTETRVRVRSPLMDDPFFRRFFNVPNVPRERVSQSLGSGVIVDARRGYVITNNHVIEGADDIRVSLKDGRTLTGELIGADPDTDVAVIRIPSDDLSALPLADSNSLQVGDFVVAVGNPFGLGQTVTSGIVSALGRVGIRGLEFQNFIQTDASINPGNSGGALINLRGELVGINTAIFTPSGGNVGIGFAIPSSMVNHVMQQLVEYGEVRRGWLGVEVQSLTPELAGAFGLPGGSGAVIAEIEPGSAADKAGLEPGDVITRMGSEVVRSEQDFRNVEGLMPIGQRLAVDYIREGRKGRASVVIEARQIVRGRNLDGRLDGGLFEALPERVARQTGSQGVYLSEVEPGSNLWLEGLRPGDIVIGIDRQPVGSVADFEQLVKKAGRRLLLQIRRDGRAYVAVLD